MGGKWCKNWGNMVVKEWDEVLSVGGGCNWEESCLDVIFIELVDLLKVE